MYMAATLEHILAYFLFHNEERQRLSVISDKDNYLHDRSKEQVHHRKWLVSKKIRGLP